MDGIDSVDSITQEFCDQTKVAFGDVDDHAEHGGLKTMGESLDRGQVLVMSMWDDHDANMLWLDSNYPLDKDPSEPGVGRAQKTVEHLRIWRATTQMQQSGISTSSLEISAQPTQEEKPHPQPQQRGPLPPGSPQPPLQTTLSALVMTCLTACPCAQLSHWISSRAVFLSARTSAHNYSQRQE